MSERQTIDELVDALRTEVNLCKAIDKRPISLVMPLWAAVLFGVKYPEHNLPVKIIGYPVRFEGNSRHVVCE